MSVNRLLSGGNPKPWFKKKRIVIPLIFVVSAIIAGALGGNKTSTSPTSSPTDVSATTDSSGARVYPASVDGYAVVDPATIAVRFTVHNDGSQSVSPACTITLQNVGGSYHGFDVFYMNPIAAGGVTHGTGNITITSEGAQFVSQSSISCTANTSDKSISTGTGVTVLGVTDALGAYDASTGWYWGGIIKVSGVAASTQLKCTETATDESGKVIATHTFNAVTFNDGTLTGYGEGQDPTVDATQAIAQAIKNVTATCSLN